jgi:hypothetical protein
MILDWLPRPLLRFIVRLYQQEWYHWFASILLGFWDTLFGVIYRTQQYWFRIRLWKDWQHRPSPHYPLPMTDNDIPVRPERSDAVGQYIATLIVTSADAASLRPFLPPDADVDPTYIHNGKHAIVYMLGFTENLHRVWNPLPGISYMEFAVGIPSVRIKRKDGYDFPFFYLPSLYLSRFYPVLMGWMVGYRKHWGRVYGRDKTYEIAELGGKRILSASFQTATSPALVVANVPQWRDLLNQPHANPFGPDEFLYLHYHWDWQKALLQPVKADVEVFDALPGLPPGKYQFEPLDTGARLDLVAPTGAMRVCAPFELLSPFSRKALKDYRAMMPLAPPQRPPAD